VFQNFILRFDSTHQLVTVLIFIYFERFVLGFGMSFENNMFVINFLLLFEAHFVKVLHILEGNIGHNLAFVLAFELFSLSVFSSVLKNNVCFFRQPYLSLFVQFTLVLYLFVVRRSKLFSQRFLLSKAHPFIKVCFSFSFV